MQLLFFNPAAFTQPQEPTCSPTPRTNQQPSWPPRPPPPAFGGGDRQERLRPPSPAIGGSAPGHVGRVRRHPPPHRLPPNPGRAVGVVELGPSLLGSCRNAHIAGLNVIYRRMSGSFGLCSSYISIPQNIPKCWIFGHRVIPGGFIPQSQASKIKRCDATPNSQGFWEIFNRNIRFIMLEYSPLF